jgi:immune inhibitor A
MKHTLWRALLIVALLSNVFLVLPVSATIPAPDQAILPNDPARVENLSPTPPAGEDVEPIDIGPELRDKVLPIDNLEEMKQTVRALAAKQPAAYGVGDKRIGVVLNNVTGKAILTYFTVMTKTAQVEVWLQDDLRYRFADGTINYAHPDWPEPISQAQIDYLADQFTNKVYPVDTTNFGFPDVRDGSQATLPAQLDLPADYYTGTAVIVQVENVRDARYYDPANNSSYVAGFSWGVINNWFDRTTITLDCRDWEQRLGPPNYEWIPGVKVTRAYQQEDTLVHEFQHTIHGDRHPGDDTWLNEGMSELSAYLAGYKYEPTHGRTQFLDSPENSVTLWSDRGGDTVLEDYQLSYLFTLYLMQTRGGAATIMNLINSPKNGVFAVDDVLGANAFRDIYRAFKTDMLWGGMSNDAGAPAWGIALTTPFDTSRLRRNLAFSGYARTPGAPPWGSDYIKFGYVPASDTLGPQALGTLNFKGDLGAFPTPWTVVTATTIYTPSGSVSGKALFASGYASTNDQWVVISVTVPGGSPVLSFDTYYNIESTYDYGFIQVTTDTVGAAGFVSLKGTRMITDTASDAESLIVANVPGYNGFSGGWVTDTVSLSAYAGQSVLLAFRYSTDSGAAGTNSGYPAGWALDNVKLDGATLFDETMPASAKSIWAMRGGNKFAATVTQYTEGQAPVTLFPVAIDPATQAGSLDLTTVLTQATQNAVLVASYEAPMYSDILGGAISSYGVYTVTGLPSTLLQSSTFGPANARPGDSYTYTVRLVNPGDVDATAMVTNPIPANTTFGGAVAAITGTVVYSSAINSVLWAGTVPTGTGNYGYTDMNFRVTVNPDASLINQRITNTVTINELDGTAPFSVSQNVGTLINFSVPLVDNTVSAASVYQLPSVPVVLTYTVLVTNPNASVFTQTVWITDAIPANTAYVTNTVTGGATYNAASNSILWNGLLGPLQWKQVTFAVVVSPTLAPPAAGTLITNKATIASPGFLVVPLEPQAETRVYPPRKIYLPLVARN